MGLFQSKPDLKSLIKKRNIKGLIAFLDNNALWIYPDAQFVEAVNLLAECCDPRALYPLQKCRDHVFSNAGKATQESGRSVSFQEYQETFNRASHQIRQGAAGFLPAIVKDLNDKNGAVSQRAVFALGEMGSSDEVVEALIGACGNWSSMIREKAVGFLGNSFPSLNEDLKGRVRQVILAAAQDRARDVRETALSFLIRQAIAAGDMETVVKLGSSAVPDVLEILINDPGNYQAASLRSALCRMDPAAHADMLLRLDSELEKDLSEPSFKRCKQIISLCRSMGEAPMMDGLVEILVKILLKKGMLLMDWESSKIQRVEELRTAAGEALASLYRSGKIGEGAKSRILQVRGTVIHPGLSEYCYDGRHSDSPAIIFDV